MTGLIVNKLPIVQPTRISRKTTFLHDFTLKNLALKVRQGKFFAAAFFSHPLSISKAFTNSDKWTRDYWKKRNLNLICVKSEIDEARLKHLADVCERSQKFVFLSLPCAGELPQKNKVIAWSFKRLFDFLAAMAILLIFSPVMIVLAAIIARTSSGSVFFHQWRIGERGKLFRIIKFRSMITDADKLHHLVMSGQTGLHKCEKDPRITAVGRWMRKYSLDELPQLFNVLRGEMSLVGPRPWALYDALRISGDRKRRLNSLPGVTGAWQVSARSTMLDLDAVTDCDLSYLRNWSLWSDLKILFMTVPKVLSGFGAF
jgi:lipopolysaccharide/colanic/teichoic acid biosynthesis glycosyltransferase